MEEGPAGKKVKLEFDEFDDICTVEDETAEKWQSAPNESNDTLMLDFAGPCDFGYFFRKARPAQMLNSWVFSEMLNQIYIRMGNVMHVQFNVNEAEAPSSDLYVRATPVYCSPDYLHLPVNRCMLHSLEDDPTNEAHSDGGCRCNSFKLVGHVVRSTSANAIYCYDSVTERHSVLVPIRRQIYDLLFTFTCKSSCSKGMERRPIRIVFSLEDGNGLVLGRCSLNVKICSCPKRDKERGERSEVGLVAAVVPKKRAAKPTHLMDLISNGAHNSAISSSNQSLETIDVADKLANGENGSRMSKLKSDLVLVGSHIQKLNLLCTSIEQILDSLDSDI